MIILISGSTHTGKTNFAQKLLEKYHYPYLSIDHLKMGLIRSNQTSLTVFDDEKLTDYLWNIVKEIIKTAIENKQNLIIEGCYIPFNYQDYFNEEYLKEIKYICLIMSKNYIENNINQITNNANIIENRLEDDISIKELIKDNEFNLIKCKENNLPYHLIDNEYNLPNI